MRGNVSNDDRKRDRVKRGLLFLPLSLKGLFSIILIMKRLVCRHIQISEPQIRSLNHGLGLCSVKMHLMNTHPGLIVMLTL